jgi:hypothetical protein
MMVSFDDPPGGEYTGFSNRLDFQRLFTPDSSNLSKPEAENRAAGAL